MSVLVRCQAFKCDSVAFELSCVPSTAPSHQRPSPFASTITIILVDPARNTHYSPTTSPFGFRCSAEVSALRSRLRFVRIGVIFPILGLLSEEFQLSKDDKNHVYTDKKYTNILQKCKNVFIAT